VIAAFVHHLKVLQLEAAAELVDYALLISHEFNSITDGDLPVSIDPVWSAIIPVAAAFFE
jgi:hypothetical protein